MTGAQQKQLQNKKKIVGTFQLGKTIGKGTFATVKQAIHLPTNQKVALKILHKKMIVDPRDQTNVSRQLRIIKKLRHPNIVQLFQIIETNSRLYIVMEHVKGGELYQLIVNSKKSRLTQEQASKYFQQLLNTVQYLHQLGITHRDLKPENILIGQDQTIKLIDFGLSNLYQANEQLTTPCGSPCYAAPEMLSQGQYSPLKVDVWSCGIVLYTMLCGFLPFEHENTLQLYKIVEQGNYDEPSHLSSNAKDILKKMLQPNPERRLTISQIRKHPFVSQYQEPLIRGLLPGEKIMLQASIVQQLKSLGYSGFRQDVQQNANNEHTTAFYLILFRRLALDKISHITYYSQMVELKTPYKSKSVMIKRYQNPEELPDINKKNIISLMNLTKTALSRVRNKTGANSMNLCGRSANMRIKKVNTNHRQ